MFKFTRKMKTLLFMCLMMTFAVPALAQNIYTVAGGGPNNMPALSANLDAKFDPYFGELTSSASYLAVDSSSNMYISGCDGHVFRVDRNGQLTIYAGSGTTDGF